MVTEIQLEPTEVRMKRSWLMVSTAGMLYAWARVLRTLYRNYDALQDPTNVGMNICNNKLTPDVQQALLFSFLEFFNAVFGITNSKPLFVLIFSVVRLGVEVMAAPYLPCNAWQHLITVFCWSLGDTIRFGCFILDLLVPGAKLAKSIRYTVGPLLFPFGAAGEMLIVIAVAQQKKNALIYFAAALWPVGFYPLMKQLLKQRRKFFASKNAKEIKAV